MSFNILAIVTSVVGLLLGLGWLFAGHLLLRRWRIEANPVALLVGRRIGAVYVGLATIMFLARTAPPSEVRSSLCVGALIFCTLLALLGLFEFKRGRVGPGMLSSVVVELLLAAGFLWAALA